MELVDMVIAWGVPTIAGQTSFDESYNGNILVNAMTLGHVKKDKIFYSKAAGLGKPVIYVGSKTGRDGIHGASMASASFDDKIEEKKPTVQVGDPFTEKLLLRGMLRANGWKFNYSHSRYGCCWFNFI